MPNRSPKTIRLNVGGTKYEVAKSLIETYPDTMLATMISDRWEQYDQDEDEADNTIGTTIEKELFIDRNGHRFQYVLDYMRDQKVHCAVGASGASIRKELEYFGFGNVPNDAIDVSSGNLDAAKHVLMANRESEKNIEDWKNAADSETIANLIYQEFMKRGSSSLRLSSDSKPYGISGIMLARCNETAAETNNWKSMINLALTKYGLVLNTISGSGRNRNYCNLHFSEVA